LQAAWGDSTQNTYSQDGTSTTTPKVVKKAATRAPLCKAEKCTQADDFDVAGVNTCCEEKTAEECGPQEKKAQQTELKAEYDRQQSPTCDGWKDLSWVGPFDCSKETTNKRKEAGNKACTKFPCTATDCCRQPTCDAGFDCSKETTNKRPKAATSTCALDVCTTTECCEQPTCTADFDCSKETKNTSKKAASTTCAANVCTATECCQPPAENPTCGAFDCSKEKTNTANKDKTTKCKNAKCTADDCCQANKKVVSGASAAAVSLTALFTAALGTAALY